MYLVPIFILLGYGCWLLLMYFLQDRLLFPTHLIPPDTENGRTLPGERIELTVPEGTVEALYLPPPENPDGGPAPLAVFFHGNGELIDPSDPIVVMYAEMGFAVLLPEYRGYGRSSGEPSEKAVTEDAVRFCDLATARPEVDAGRVVYHGRSLGGAVAASVARHRPPHALVLQSTFLSVSRMARRYAAPGFLVRNSFHTDEVVAALDIPILIAHGATDRIVPVSHGRKLSRIARRPTCVEYPCGHNDFPGEANVADYPRRLREFLEDAGIIPETS